MNIFKTFTLKWWQAGVLKAGLLALGIVIGAGWPALFADYCLWLAALAAICIGYVGFVWARQ